VTEWRRLEALVVEAVDKIFRSPVAFRFLSKPRQCGQIALDVVQESDFAGASFTGG
jgi:hypothetical protein